MNTTGDGLSTFRPILGTDEATIDDKGRVPIARKKRERLGDHFVLSHAPAGCLAAYPREVWEQLTRSIFSHGSLNIGTEHYSRLMLGSAEDDMDCDAQGRVLVPQRLRDQAKLKDKILIVGCGNRLEFWSKAEYDNYLEAPTAYGSTRRSAFDTAYQQMQGA